MTSSASAYTAPSTHPPDTLPTASPSADTAIAAPAWRGADFHVRTTVASPNVSPWAYHSLTSPSTSRMDTSFSGASGRVQVVDPSTEERDLRPRSAGRSRSFLTDMVGAARMPVE